MAITAPPEIKYGYVVGKIVRTIADDIDADSFPDTVPASGQVTFKPVRTTSTTKDYPAIVMHDSIMAIVYEEDGELRSTTGEVGVWLVTGIYDVVFNLNFGALSGFQITVTEEHTEVSPLDLANSRPITAEPTVRFVVNEQVYINTLAAADRAEADATTATTQAGISTTQASIATTEADRAASEVTRRITELKDSGEITGPQGPEGPKGDTGDQGIQGIQGIQGDIGPSNTLTVGTVSESLTDASASITGTSPDQTLNLTLKTGATGAKGDKGDTGDTGPQGEQGLQGPQGVQGDTGLQGIQGPQGEKGDKGDQGQGLNVVGSLADPAELPASGAPGDAYLISGDLWVWSETVGDYVNAGTIEGEQGPIGPQGPEGPKGDTGDQGIQGIQGIQGPQGTPGVDGVDGINGDDSVLPLKTIAGTTEAPTDLNTLIETGIYPLQSSTIITNNPTAAAAVLIVYPFHDTNSTWRIQEYTHWSTKRKFVRSTNDGGVSWNEWREYAGTEVATTSADGLMSRFDKETLDAVPVASSLGRSIITSETAEAVVALLNLSVGTTADLNTGTSTVNSIWSAKSLADYVEAQVPEIPLATSTTDGLMPKEDKALIDTATQSATGDALVLRDANGQISVPNPTANWHAASKSYVDSASLSGSYIENHPSTFQASVDSITETGEYMLLSSEGGSPYSNLSVRSEGQLILQSIMSIGSVSTRATMDGGTTWSDWEQLVSKDDTVTDFVNGTMSYLDKRKLDGIEEGATAGVSSNNITDATTTGKALLTTSSATTARSTLGLLEGATSSAGTAYLLSIGTSTSPRVWAANTLVNYIQARGESAERKIKPIDGSKHLIIGDSNSLLSTNQIDGRSYTVFAPALSGGRLFVSGSIAASGHNAAQQASALTTYLNLSSSNHTSASIMVGTNDLTQNVTLEQWSAKIEQMVVALLNKDISPILMTIPPRSGPTSPKPASQIQDQWNDWLKIYGAKYGFPVVDVWSAVTDPATREFKSGLYNTLDGVHINGRGQMLVAEEFMRVMDQHLQGVDSQGPGSLTPGTFDSKALNPVTTFESATLPSDYWTSAGVMKMDSGAPGGYAVEFSLNNFTGNSNLYPAKITGLSAGQRIRVVVLARVMDSSSSVSGAGMQLLFRTWQGSGYTDFIEELYGLNLVSRNYMEYSMERVLPSGTDGLTVYWKYSIGSDTTASIKYRVGGLGVYNVNTSLT